MQTGQRANHDNADGQAVPQPTKSNLLVNTAECGAHRLAGCAVGVNLGHHDVCGVRHHGAEDAGNVAAEERHARLRELGVLVLLFGQQLVDLLDGALETGKLDHGVGDLARPQRRQALVQPGHAFLGHNLGVPFKHGLCKRRDCGLLTHLDGLPGTEKQVCKKLRRGGRRQVQLRAVAVRGLRADQVSIPVLEQLVEAVLARALERVSDEGRANAREDAWETALGLDDCLPALNVGLVQRRAHLAPRLDEIEWGDGRVRRPTREHTTQRAVEKVLRRIDHNLAGLRCRRADKILRRRVQGRRLYGLLHVN